jgi:hypothetical protein
MTKVVVFVVVSSVVRDTCRLGTAMVQQEAGGRAEEADDDDNSLRGSTQRLWRRL